ncbi:class A beta-lactamase-related serine hydrolase [Mycolicibacterium moriokaense]|nr:class A beta-lactamase-related serine hydrolase [Mycolicibacterium moriokaense]
MRTGQVRRGVQSESSFRFNRGRSMRTHFRNYLALILVPAMALSPSRVAAASPASLEDTLRPVIANQMELMQIPGLIVAVQTPDRGSWQAAFGVADTATGLPMDVADHMRVGSITKSFTATVILELAQEGRLGLDDKLAPFFPGFNTNGATIRQALQLTSGIADYTTVGFLNALADDPKRVWSPEELLATVANQPPMFPAGTSWYYSNTNYVMLGMIAEQVTGEPLRQLLADRVFTPLNMTGCSVPEVTDAGIPQPFSRGYQFGTDWGRSSTPPAPLPPLLDVTDINPSWGAGAGAAICTVADLTIWARALATGELLDPAMQTQRLSWYPAQDPKAKYGLGVVDINGLVGHNGEISGYMSQAARRESDGTIIVVLTNLTTAPDNNEPATVISEMVSRAIPA